MKDQKLMDAVKELEKSVKRLKVATEKLADVTPNFDVKPHIKIVK